MMVAILSHKKPNLGFELMHVVVVGSTDRQLKPIHGIMTGMNHRIKDFHVVCSTLTLLV